MNHSKLLGIFSLFAVSAAVACGSPDVGKAPSHGSGMTVPSSHSFKVTASSKTQEALGISSWHVLTEGDSTSTIVEGVDAKGKVKFASSFLHDGTMFQIKSYQGVDGKLEVTKSAGEYKLTDTLDHEAWQKYADAFMTDSKNGKSSVEYAASKVGTNPATAAMLKKLADQIKALQDKNAALTAAQQKKDAAAQQAALKSLFDQGKAMLSNMMKQAQAAAGKSAGGGGSSGGAGGGKSGGGGEKGAGGGKSGGKSSGDDGKKGDDDDDTTKGDDDDDTTKGDDDDDTTKGDDDDDTTKGDDDDDTTKDTGDETGNDQGNDVSDTGDVSANEGDNGLDDGGDFGGDDTGGGDDFGGDEGGGDEGGGDEGGGDEGGGDEFAFHGNTCQHLSCSKTTKVCVCTKY